MYAVFEGVVHCTSEMEFPAEAATKIGINDVLDLLQRL
jgi:hypothetical protein